ncbi:MAG TPA: secretin N-terminal domain-containing protein [Burkholderiales bacterium]|nr:secretin N-terminal domain-containing protein [Burkholderiales bacterium]
MAKIPLIRLLEALRQARIWLLLAATAGVAFAQAMVVEVLPLRYRTAEELIPVIRPVLAREGSVSGFQGRLVVRTTPANLEEIRRILESLDVAPRQLLITVRQDVDAGRGERDAEISGRGGSDRARVIVPEGGERRGASVVLREGDERLRARVFESHIAESERGTQTVRVLEGREAFVRIGQSVPVREREVRRTAVGGQVIEQVVEGTRYREAATGFHVLARLAGDRVTLDISPQREALSTETPESVRHQRVVTTVSARLGEWVEIGGALREAEQRQSVLLGRTAAAAAERHRVLIRVEEAR